MEQAIAARAGVGWTTATGFLTGALIGMLGAIASMPLRRLGDVSDRSYLNGISVMLLAVGLWTVGGLVHGLWTRRGGDSRPLLVPVTLAVAALLCLYVWIDQGPLTPYPRHFIALAVPVFVIITLGGVPLFRLLIERLKLPAYTVPGGFVAAAMLAGIVAYADKAPGVHYTLSKAHPSVAASQVAGATTATAPRPPAAGAPQPAPAITPAAAATVSGPKHFTVSQQTEASYTVREKLTRLPAPSDAIGKTSAITGDLYLLPGGLAPSPPSSFTVDLRTLTSDAPQRDRFIKGQTLDTTHFPMATYTITSVDGFPANYKEGDDVSLTLSGTFDVHGVQKSLTWTGTARYQDHQLEAVASTSFDMHDFNITPPNVSVAVAESTVKLDLHLFATEQGS